jgi:hypothetical protein
MSFETNLIALSMRGGKYTVCAPTVAQMPGLILIRRATGQPVSRTRRSLKVCGRSPRETNRYENQLLADFVSTSSELPALRAEVLLARANASVRSHIAIACVHHRAVGKEMVGQSPMDHLTRWRMLGKNSAKHVVQ